MGKREELVARQEISLIKTRKYMAGLLDDKLGETSKASLRVDVEPSIEYLGRKMMVSFDVLANKIVEDKYPVYYRYRVPSSWWQMLKRDKLPRWFRRRYPVEFTDKTVKRTVHFTRYAEYPMANLAIPKDTHFFRANLGGVEVIRDAVDHL